MAADQLQALREDILFTRLLVSILIQDLEGVNFLNIRYKFHDTMRWTEP